MEAGKRIEAWTLEWDEDSGTLRKMRSKETEADYRYFREPDLLPIRMDRGMEAADPGGLPGTAACSGGQRFVEQYGLPEYDADILTSERRLSDYFENSGEGVRRRPQESLQLADERRAAHDQRPGTEPGGDETHPGCLAEIIKLVDTGTINITTGKALLEKVQDTGKCAREARGGEGLAQVSDDSAIRAVCEEVLAENPNEVAAYKGGKVTLIGWFVGQVMKKMRGKADASLARTILEELLMLSRQER